jgi:hypothetical protein
MQTSQTKKNPSNPATALKTQINEVSISSGMFFCSIMGETLCINQNIVPLPAFDAWITMNPASRLSNRDYFGTFLDGAPG